jgi:phenylpyruvate tautomerase PptA (4-oxalocrotonate tautomerase family)
MPIAYLDVPAGATRSVKSTLVSEMTTSLEQAYRVPDTRLFVREWAPGETSQDGQLNAGGPRPVCFLEVPPDITVEAKRTLVQQISAAVTRAYGLRDVLIFLREYPLDMVSQDGGLQSENPMILEAMRNASAGR